MLFKFSSRATADVKMFETDVKTLMNLIGKEAGRQGIITVAEMPAAIAKLEAAIRREAAEGKHNHDATVVEGHPDKAEVQHVGLHQRATPLIEMMRNASAEAKDIVWTS